MLRKILASGVREKFCKYFSSKSKRQVLPMSVAYFRLYPGEDNIHISFSYKNPELKVDRTFNFNRNAKERVAICLERIKSNIDKEFVKKNKAKKKKQSGVVEAVIPSDVEKVEPAKVPPNIVVALYERTEAINDNTFLQLFTESRKIDDFVLHIAEQKYSVAFNVPWVNIIALPSSILAGFWLYPSKCDVHFADRQDCQIEWFRGKMPKSKKEDDIEWQAVGNGLAYQVTPDDVDYRLKVKCTPCRGQICGPATEYISTCNVHAGPGECLFDFRHAFTTQKLSEESFRVLSFNILADLYADSDYSRQQLFPYCPPYALHIDYRKQLFIKEIIGYKSDIMCLQEVDYKIFNLDLGPVLKMQNYTGTFREKGTSGEGLAIFVNNDRFEIVKEEGIVIGEQIDKLEIFKNVWECVELNEKLAVRVKERATALHVVTVRSKDFRNRYIIVANTHLYFHPDADHIRLLQMGLSMLYVQNVYEKTVQLLASEAAEVSILFCGDFNSVPECGIFKLMTTKLIGKNYRDWESNRNEAVRGVGLRQPFDFASACGVPAYTNFTAGFKACLDYIFFETNKLEVLQVVPFPDKEQLEMYEAIPSVVYPSDHVALVADLKWKISK